MMSKTITSEILVAYSQCPRKAYLLLCTGEQGTPHEYVRILEQQRQATQQKYLNILRRNNVDVQSYSPDKLTGKHEFLIDATLEANGLAADCAFLNKVRTHSALGRYSYEPTIFAGTHSIKKEQKLELFYVSHVLEQVQNRRPVSGRIIGLDAKSHKVKLEDSLKTLRPFLEPLQEWAGEPSPEPPPLILNRHCPICQFRNLCRTKAEQEDNLSLLDGISTPKAINKYQKKGLFTVKQLSYTFKPRKRKKRAKNPPPVIHKPELQALAIREGKIYLQELPELIRQSVELFLDIEGVPDRQFYYLIGLLVNENGATTYHPFWANTSADEAQMWGQFLAKVSQYPEAPIYHYGSFEPRALTKLAKRYDTDGDSFAEQLVNVNEHIFGKVYFPVYSNRLKEIGAFIGAKWSSPQASALQSLVWRHHWEEIRSAEYKGLLLTYNEEDCQALKLLTDELSEIKDKADSISDLDFGNRQKRYSIKADNPAHHQLEAILKFAHSDFDKKKISFRQMVDNQEKKRPRSSLRGTRKKIIRKPTRTVRLPHRTVCPKCEDKLLVETQRTSENIVVDLIFTKNGVRKTTTKYWATKGYCKKCRHFYNPSGFNEHGCPPLYGYGFKVWIAYHRVALRLSYQSLELMIEDFFNEKINSKLLINYIRDVALRHSETEKLLIARILDSTFLHADETKINIRGENWYVWVFTNGKHVAFKLTETRESTVVHKLLAAYSGILISDFYPGYDSIQCKQQKCWVHLIRDLNNDLWGAPFDTEFGALVLETKNLIIPILVAVDKYGLKKRNLNKFKKSVDKFYKNVIVNKRYKSELAIKYQNRFIKYRDSLFTFLEYDGVPWHNNTAENAIRHFALQRRISVSFYESTSRDYLLLLGIRQTCRFQDKSFLRFLLSEETDLDKFEANKRKRRVL
jgi:predicted RecB family nuclease